MEFDAQPAESSPAPSDVLGALNDSERLEWQKTGELPADKFTSPFADSTPAEPVEQAAPTGATPEAASEPAKPKKKGADARVEELLADRAEARARAERLEKRLAELERGNTGAQSAVTPPAPAVSTADAEPTLELNPATGKGFDTYEQFVKAQARWEARQEFKEQQRIEREQRDFQAFAESQEKRLSTFTEKVKAAIVADPTFEAKTSELAKSLYTTEWVKAENAERQARGQRPELLKPENYLADEIVDSSVPDALMAHLGTNKDDLAYVLAADSPKDLARRVGEIEGLVKRAAKSAPTTTTKTITSAPAVPTFLGSRPATASDPAEAALKRGDSGGYIREMNARELAART